MNNSRCNGNIVTVYTAAMLCAALGLFPRPASAESTGSSGATKQGSTPADPTVKALMIDLTGSPPPLMKGHLGLGTTRRPNGETVDADSRCLYRNGRPWIPVWGEFHFSRYPSEEWRDELLKMKAGGVDIVASCVIWIHHEEQQGQFDWSGQRSLRGFIQLCQELGLQVVLRMGPWSHGEVRNGGLPDWVQHSGLPLRSQNPAFLKLVELYWMQMAAQMRGLLWKDGGPIIGILLDDECKDLSYLFTLKTMARSLGVDVPFYTMTGWQSNLPREGLMPLSGNYADGFWTRDRRECLDSFMFRPVEMVGKASMGVIGKKDSGSDGVSQIGRYPYLCCELGGGMISGYDRRIFISPPDVAAVAVVTMGNGSNMPGYYMFQGGINPEGKYSTLNETRASGYPSDLPVKDYDFGPLGACGQVREHYHLLRQQHLFLKQFGEALAVMPAFLPDRRPANCDDVATMRWNMRSDGRSGFLFFNNYQRFLPLPVKKGVQFSLKTNQGTLLAPSEPVAIPSGAYGIWPVNIDCGGVAVKYSTAQPICSLKADGQDWFFFAAIEGIQPDFVVSDIGGQTRVQNITPATAVAFTRQASDGRKVNFVVLSADRGWQLWKLPLAGRERVALSPDAILPDSAGQIRIETTGARPPALAVFPPVAAAAFDGRQVAKIRDGVFQRFTAPAVTPSPVVVGFTAVKAADADGDKSLNAMHEESWKNAAVWRLDVPQDVRDRKFLLRIHYVGDVARVYAGGRLISDNFYNGQPFDLAYWRIPREGREGVEIRLLPLRGDHVAFLPEDIHPNLPTSAGLADVSRIEAVELTQITVALKGDGKSP